LGHFLLGRLQGVLAGSHQADTVLEPLQRFFQSQFALFELPDQDLPIPPRRLRRE
jgi:hypothetical protein